MKTKPFTRFSKKIRLWRYFAVSALLVVVVWLGFSLTLAQIGKPKRITSIQASDTAQGARVTIVADLALSDYEAFRRGDRFYVKVPSSDLATGQPRLRANGFDEVQVQRTGDSVVLSFKLQTGATARVDQHLNRLDVVFTALNRTNANPQAVAQRNDTSSKGSSSVNSSSANTTSDRRDGEVGPTPPTSGESTRASRPNEPGDRTGASANERANTQSDTREFSSSTAPKTNQLPANSGAVGNSGPGTSLQESGAQSNLGSNSTASSSGSPGSIPTLQQSGLSSVNSNPTPLSSKPLVLNRATVQNWVQMNWRWMIAGAMVLLILLLVLFTRFRRPKSRTLKAGQRNKLRAERLEALANETVDSVPLEDKEEQTEVTSAIGADTVATAGTEEDEIKDLTLTSAEHSPLPEVKEAKVEPVNSNTPTPLEHTELELKKLLAGYAYDASLIDVSDLTMRQVVAAGLISALASRNSEQHEPARRAFVDYGYFDETTRDLRTADSPAERAAAARKLGVIGETSANAHLIAALNDTAPEVRRAAVESLGLLGDHTAIAPLNELLQRETSRQLPEAVIRHAINSITVTEVNQTATERPTLRVVEKTNQSDEPQRDNLEFENFAEALKRDIESQVQNLASVSPAAPDTPPVTSLPPTTPVSPTESQPTQEEIELEIEEQSLRRAAEDLERRRLEAEVARQRAEEESRFRAEQEVQVRAEIEARIRAEEEARRRVEEETRLRKLEEEARLSSELEARAKAEEEARNRAEEEARFRLEAETLRRAAEELVRKRAEAEIARKLAEDESRRLAEEEARQRIEEEANRAREEAKRLAEEEIRREVEIEVRRRIEAEARQRVEDEVRRAEDERIRAEAEAEAWLTVEETRRRVEEEARRIAEEQARRAVEEARAVTEEEVRQHVAEDARKAVAEESRRLVVQDALRRSQAEGLLREAEERRSTEEEQFRLEQEALLKAADDVARRRREIEEARKRAEEEALLLLAAQQRIRADEEARQVAEIERQRIEAEARQRAEEERKRFEESRQRAEEQRRIEEEARQKALEEVQLLAATQERIRAEEEARRAMIEQQRRLEQEARQRAEEGARLLAAAQQRILAEEQARKAAEEEQSRIEAEARQRAEEERLRFEDARQRVIAEQKRIEDEVRRQVEEEDRRLAELGRLKRQAEEQLRQREEQEQRIRAEIESLLRAEEEQRQRIEAETQRRAEAESRLREERTRREAEELARVNAEKEAHLAEDARLRAEEDARRREEQEARVRAEREARMLAEEEARRREEDEARQYAEREARLRAEEDAQRRADEEARLYAEEAQRRRAEEEERQRAQEAVHVELDLEQLGLEAEQLLAANPYHTESSSSDSVLDDSATVDSDGLWAGLVVEDETVAVPKAPPVNYSTVQSTTEDVDKGIDIIRAEKGIAPVGEESDISAELLHLLNSELAAERATALAELAKLGGEDAFRFISRAFDDQAVDVRSAAARALYDLQADRAASFTRALREGSPERRRKIGAALASSGLADNAITNLTGESREKTYDAFSLLFLMAKAGEVQPLMKAIEEYPNVEVRLAVVKLLALSGQPEIVPAFRRLAVRGSLPSEVRSAVMEAIYQISSQGQENATSAA